MKAAFTLLLVLHLNLVAAWATKPVIAVGWALARANTRQEKLAALEQFAVADTWELEAFVPQWGKLSAPKTFATTIADYLKDTDPVIRSQMLEALTKQTPKRRRYRVPLWLKNSDEIQTAIALNLAHPENFEAAQHLLSERIAPNWLSQGSQFAETLAKMQASGQPAIREFSKGLISKLGATDKYEPEETDLQPEEFKPRQVILNPSLLEDPKTKMSAFDALLKADSKDVGRWIVEQSRQDVGNWKNLESVLTRSLRDPDPETRAHAVALISHSAERISVPEPIRQSLKLQDELAKNLDNPDPRISKGAQKILKVQIKPGQRATTPAFKEILLAKLRGDGAFVDANNNSTGRGAAAEMLNEAWPSDPDVLTELNRIRDQATTGPEQSYLDNLIFGKAKPTTEKSVSAAPLRPLGELLEALKDPTKADAASREFLRYDSRAYKNASEAIPEVNQGKIFAEAIAHGSPLTKRQLLGAIQNLAPKGFHLPLPLLTITEVQRVLLDQLIGDEAAPIREQAYDILTTRVHPNYWTATPEIKAAALAALGSSESRVRDVAAGFLGIAAPLDSNVDKTLRDTLARFPNDSPAMEEALRARFASRAAIPIARTPASLSEIFGRLASHPDTQRRDVKDLSQHGPKQINDFINSNQSRARAIEDVWLTFLKHPDSDTTALAIQTMRLASAKRTKGKLAPWLTRSVRLQVALARQMGSSDPVTRAEAHGLLGEQLEGHRVKNDELTKALVGAATTPGVSRKAARAAVELAVAQGSRLPQLENLLQAKFAGADSIEETIYYGEKLKHRYAPLTPNFQVLNLLMARAGTEDKIGKVFSEGLRSSNVDERRSTLAALQLLVHPPGHLYRIPDWLKNSDVAQAAVIEGFKDRNNDLRNAFQELYARFRPEERSRGPLSIDAAIRITHSPEDASRKISIELLTDPATNLSTPSAETYFRLVHALARMEGSGEPPLRAALIDKLHQGHAFAKTHGGGYHGPEALHFGQLLERALNSKDPQARIFAATATGWLLDDRGANRSDLPPDTAEKLSAKLADLERGVGLQPVEVREAARAVLRDRLGVTSSGAARVPRPESLPAVSEVLGNLIDQSGPVRLSAAEKLQHYPKDQMEKMIRHGNFTSIAGEALRNYPKVRFGVLTALSNFLEGRVSGFPVPREDAPRLLAAIGENLGHENEPVAELAKSVINRWELPLPKGWKDDEDLLVRSVHKKLAGTDRPLAERTLSDLIDISPRGKIPPWLENSQMIRADVIEALLGENENMKKLAVRLIRKDKGGPYAEHLLELVRAEKSQDREKMMAMALLSPDHIDIETARHLADIAANHEDLNVRRAAAFLLSQSGVRDIETFTRLANALKKEPHGEVGALALLTLSKAAQFLREKAEERSREEVNPILEVVRSIANDPTHPITAESKKLAAEIMSNGPNPSNETQRRISDHETVRNAIIACGESFVDLVGKTKGPKKKFN